MFSEIVLKLKHIVEFQCIIDNCYYRNYKQICEIN